MSNGKLEPCEGHACNGLTQSQRADASPAVLLSSSSLSWCCCGWVCRSDAQSGLEPFNRVQGTRALVLLCIASGGLHFLAALRAYCTRTVEVPSTLH